MMLEDEESLFLTLEISEGKRFTDEVICSLLKKEYHIRKGTLELKEYLYYFIVFHSLYERVRKSYEGYKVCF